MTKCDFCGEDYVEKLDPFMNTCQSCSDLYVKLGFTIKAASEKDGTHMKNIKKMIVSIFADAGHYIEIKDN